MELLYVVAIILVTIVVWGILWICVNISVINVELDNLKKDNEVLLQQIESLKDDIKDI